MLPCLCLTVFSLCKILSDEYLKLLTHLHCSPVDVEGGVELLLDSYRLLDVANSQLEAVLLTTWCQHCYAVSSSDNIRPSTTMLSAKMDVELCVAMLSWVYRRCRAKDWVHSLVELLCWVWWCISSHHLWSDCAESLRSAKTQIQSSDCRRV